MITTNSLKFTSPFIRFLMVGVINTLVGLSGIFLLLNVVGLSYWLATFVGNCLGAAVSYLLNKRFTFESKSSLGKSLPLFVLVILTCYFISFSVSRFVANLVATPNGLLPLQYTSEIAVLLGTALYTITNYLGQRYIVFN